MRGSLWSIAIAGLGLGLLAMVGGTAIGGELGPLAAGYGLLAAFAALYLVIGLAIRESLRGRLSSGVTTSAQADRLAGRRIF